MRVRSTLSYGLIRSVMPNRARSGALIRPCRVVAPMGRERGHGDGMHPRARTRADDQVDPVVLKGRVQHLLDIRQQAMNLVNEEDLLGLHGGEHSR